MAMIGASGFIAAVHHDVPPSGSQRAALAVALAEPPPKLGIRLGVPGGKHRAGTGDCAEFEEIAAVEGFRGLLGGHQSLLEMDGVGCSVIIRTERSR